MSTPREHVTRSRANPGGIADVLKVLGPEVQPHRGRKPPWFKVPAPGGPKYRELSQLIQTENLHTVCQEAACPNIGECWQRGTATFMILGDTCTRRCGFCNVKTGKPTWNDPLEPARVARSVAKMNLRHAVITSVDRDDLPDLGAGAFVGVIRQIRRQSPKTKIEVLTPDFRGEEMPLAKVIHERPDVFNHNVEVVPRLYPVARRGSRWERSNRVLRTAKEMGGDEVVTKSGLMVGLGESFEEMVDALGQLRANHVQVITVGQYLRPTERHLPVVRYWHPDEFKALEEAAYAMGFDHIAAGPLVRSSYHADQHVPQDEPGKRPARGDRHCDGSAMTPRRRILLVAVGALVLTLLVAAPALASAGGGWSGFGGGGGGRGAGLYILIQILIRVAIFGHGLGALFVIALILLYVMFTQLSPHVRGFYKARRSRGHDSRRRIAKRERRVDLAAAEAAEEDEAFAPDAVRSAAATLFAQVQAAWSAEDHVTLHRLVGPRLLGEWERRLADFAAKGWHNDVQVLDAPTIQYVGLTRGQGGAPDQVVVRIQARLRDVVHDRAGRRVPHPAHIGDTTSLLEYWTLQRRGDSWQLASIEQGAEGAHAMDEQIVATAWGDDQALRDEALVQGAAADAVPVGTDIAQLADLSYDGDAHAAALDLSLADGRFAPDILEVSARRAVSAWAQAIDGDGARLRGLAGPDAITELLHPGDPSRASRLVVRGPQITKLAITGLDPQARPPRMTVEVTIRGRRYIEDRATTAVVSGDPTRERTFTERWTFALSGDDAQPWRIVTAQAPASIG